MTKIRFAFVENDLLDYWYKETMEDLIDILGEDKFISLKDNNEIWKEYNDGKTYTVEIEITEDDFQKVNGSSSLKSFKVIQ